MEAERDMAMVALPFAAGVGIIVSASVLQTLNAPMYSGLSCLVILLSVTLLLHPAHRNIPPLYIRLITGLCLASCGASCAIFADAASAAGPAAGRFIEYAGSFRPVIGDAIDSISFSNPDTNAILKALIIGDRSDIPPHITEAFRSSGASHILALSGLHLGIIYGIISRTMSVLGNTQQAQVIRSVSVCIMCGLYTMAVGAGPSILRAFLFILLGEAARITGRFRSIGTVLMTALMIHLTVDPKAIREIGFQLSYAAMAGIAFIFPWLKGFWPETSAKGNPAYWIWKTASMSISCQITTGPLAWFYFGTFPVHFLLTNLIALPLIGLIIPSALLTTGLDLCGICPEIVSRATEVLVTALSDALEIISSM